MNEREAIGAVLGATDALIEALETYVDADERPEAERLRRAIVVYRELRVSIDRILATEKTL